MNEVITVRIIRPNFSGMDAVTRRTVIKEISDDIAAQIAVSENARVVQENYKYWQQKIIDWQVEDLRNEALYGKLKRDN